MKRRKVLCVFLACLTVVVFSGTGMAREASFTKVHVDSNSWVLISSLKKETTTKTADFKLTNIYKADGSASNYVKIEAMVKDGYAKIAYRGVTNTMQIPSSRQAAGKYAPLMAMGYNPRLDCRISGSWIVH